MDAIFTPLNPSKPWWKSSSPKSRPTARKCSVPSGHVPTSHFLRPPEKFPRKPLERSDEDGHWDNSSPPSIELKNRTGPKLFKVSAWATSDIATESGFYHSWKRVTVDPGLYIARDGSLWGCEETGTGSVGQYAAYPGDCGVDCKLEWAELEEVTTEQLREALEAISSVAFPLATAALARKAV